jgi:hypothetical protein
MEFSRCTRAAPTENRRLEADGLSKLNSVRYVEVDVFLGDLVNRTERELHQTGQEPPE